MTTHILVLNGPNLNMLGRRQPEIYGDETLPDVEARCKAVGKELGVQVEFRQTNNEGELISWIQEAADTAQALVINAASLTHTSVGILDALKFAGLPTVEVHISNIFKREEFRQHSFVTEAAIGMICGLGVVGYELAIRALAARV